MPHKKGTKLTDTPKDTMIRVRMDAEAVEKLDECADILKSNRSDAIRKGIDRLHCELKQNE